MFDEWRDTKTLRTSGTKKRMMFIDQLLTMHLQGADLSEKDIFDEVNTFMFEVSKGPTWTKVGDYKLTRIMTPKSRQNTTPQSP